MATVALAKADFLEHALYTWTPLTTTNADGSGAGYAGAGDRSVQVSGTFGVGGTCIVEGTLDGTNWFAVNDLSGVAMTFATAGIKGIREDVILVRPRVTAGDGTTSLTAVLCVRRLTSGY
jgi:hypothetical protein